MTPQKQDSVRCRMCRYELFKYSEALDSHGNPIKGAKEGQTSCDTEVWYIPEDKMPEWMKGNLEGGEWVKGKINCPNPKCTSRLGSYNFVSGMKCTCKSHVLPPIHIVKSKVDVLPQLTEVEGGLAPIIAEISQD